ncbi:Uncharacterized protein M6B38_238030 [Iris pallida]|uniref:Uncharacterized protein n=1 Tax=Iris pallida TaxID=29817 RepID=A0AAX6DLC0_IRIPA|nr:Uncharacterized protein M6B38_238030 [Iris pallida]
MAAARSHHQVLKQTFRLFTPRGVEGLSSRGPSEEFEESDVWNCQPEPGSLRADRMGEGEARGFSLVRVGAGERARLAEYCCMSTRAIAVVTKIGLTRRRRRRRRRMGCEEIASASDCDREESGIAVGCRRRREDAEGEGSEPGQECYMGSDWFPRLRSFLCVHACTAVRLLIPDLEIVIWF